MKLTDRTCRNLKPEEKPYKRADGGGLHLLVNPNGSKLWRVKYRYLGKEKLLSLGSYPIVTLADARAERDEAKALLTRGIDPSKIKKEKKTLAIRNAQNSFKSIALEWHAKNTNRWSEGYSQKILNRLESNVFPFIGSRPINEIKPPELLNDCLRRIEKRGAYDMAGRTRQVCAQVFQYGIQTGLCEWNPAENLKWAIQAARKEHFRSMDIKRLPDFIRALERNEARLYERTRRAVWLSLYTFCRPVEIRKARWQDIDFKEKVWVIPAEFMKMRRDHVVPLSEQALLILEAQKEELRAYNSEWVFPSQVRPRNPMSDGTVNKAIRRLGFGGEMVAHGFRALARTTIREKLGYDSEVIERQLAHKASGVLGEAYDRTQFLDDRATMMQDWADYIGQLK